jgi:hypothetical protein
MKHYKAWLASVWFIGSGLVLLLLIIQTSVGRYGDKVPEVLGWFFTNVGPTLGMIVSVLAIEAKGKAPAHPKPPTLLFRLAIGLSGFYLFSLLLTIFMQSFSSTPALQLMQESNLWLGPMQSLVAGALGAFFVKNSSSPKEKPKAHDSSE